MADKTKIEWSDATWNPVTGCTKVSAGCDHCYAETLHERFHGKGSFAIVQRSDVKVLLPLKWKKPRRIFVNSMSDLFHDDVPDSFIAHVFSVMARTPRHTYQVLTKRHARMRALLSRPSFRDNLDAWSPVWPLPNVWLGISAEDQRWYTTRWPALRETPAAVRFISFEPLLGSVSLFANSTVDGDPMPDWVIVGGESGPGARPMHPLWARQLRDECVEHGIPFLFKQRGEWTWNEPGKFVMPAKPYSDRVAVMHGAGMTGLTKSNPFNPFERGHPFWATRIERVGKKSAGRELDGRTWDEYPAGAA